MRSVTAERSFAECLESRRSAPETAWATTRHPCANSEACALPHPIGSNASKPMGPSRTRRSYAPRRGCARARTAPTPWRRHVRGAGARLRTRRVLGRPPTSSRSNSRPSAALRRHQAANETTIQASAGRLTEGRRTHSRSVELLRSAGWESGWWRPSSDDLLPARPARVVPAVRRCRLTWGRRPTRGLGDAQGRNRSPLHGVQSPWTGRSARGNR